MSPTKGTQITQESPTKGTCTNERAVCHSWGLTALL